MKNALLLTSLLALLGLGLMACTEEDTKEASCDPACGENQTCVVDEAGETATCECNAGYRFNSDSTACVQACPAAEGDFDPCADYDGATCQEDGDNGVKCVCDEGFTYRADVGCVQFVWVAAVCTGGPTGLASATEGSDIDAIGVNDTWCASENDVKYSKGAKGNVDAAHQNKAGVVGAPGGTAGNAATYISLGLPNDDGTGNGWVACKFANPIVSSDTVKVAELTGQNAADEPYDVVVCYADPETDLPDCVKLGSEPVGGAPNQSKTTEFPATALSEGDGPAAKPVPAEE